MNGRAARRIRRAALHTVIAQGEGERFRTVRKRLKREYKVLPYHKRKTWGYVSLSHKAQEQRWWQCNDERRMNFG